MVDDETSYSDTSGFKEPEFNSGIAYLKRIDELIKHIEKTFIIKNYDNCVSTLHLLYIEVSPRMTQEDKDNFKSLKKFIYYSNNQKSYFKNDKKYNEDKILELWECLNLIVHKLKLIMPDKKDINASDLV